MEYTHTHAFFRGSISSLLLLLILSMPFSILSAQDDLPTCSPPEEQCSSDAPLPDYDAQPAVTEAVQVHVAAPPPPVTPIMGNTTNR
ncbi:MAG: hypothetical protein ABW125_12020 [Candidatus Thiodiazotropha lotti]|nr:hypothetical protein [Candidatus Thiodiazotropha lotti]MCG8014413.1 hypothetical protein [Candidatus Thiodiazotropha lotti]MCW4213894.1 hypothetical protein [Candidatus Thiodiazotropha lotti]MCW4216025.1 hypothetical protein [Candidatus Thiodiazotropha lotti]